MRSKFSYLAVIFLSVMAMSVLASCSCSKKKEKSDVKDEKELVEPRTADVKIFESLPIKGRDAEYFTFTGIDGASTVKLSGKPEDDGYFPEGVIKAEIELTITKTFPDKVLYLAGYPEMALIILDEDKEKIGQLKMSDTDKEVIINELSKAQPGTVTINYKGTFDNEDYYEIFEKAKYVCIDTAEIRGEKETSSNEESYVEPEPAVEQTTTTPAAAYSSYSAADDDDEDDYDEDESSSKTKMKEIKEKVKEKYNNAKEKALDKINSWLD